MAELRQRPRRDPADLVDVLLGVSIGVSVGLLGPPWAVVGICAFVIALVAGFAQGRGGRRG